MPSLRLLALVALAAAIGPSVAAAEDCTLETSALRSYLDLRSPKIAKLVSTRRPDTRKPEGRRFEQTVQLTTGPTVTFSVYGCEHFGFSFSFRPVAGVTKSTPLRELARIAREQVSAVPIRTADQASLGGTAEDLSEEALAKATDMGGGSYSIPVGDASYDLRVPEPGVLEIAYDFAL
jgi:hypothetical protein